MGSIYHSTVFLVSDLKLQLVFNGSFVGEANLQGFKIEISYQTSSLRIVDHKWPMWKQIQVGVTRNFRNTFRKFSWYLKPEKG